MASTPASELLGVANLMLASDLNYRNMMRTTYAMNKIIHIHVGRRVRRE
jgi:hypothetical protein